MGKAATMLAAILFPVLPAAAQDAAPEAKLDFAFKDASVEAVLLYVSHATGWIFVQEVPVRGTITAYSRAEVPVSRCLEFLEACLRPHGLTLRGAAWPRVPRTGETVRILDAAKAAPTQPGVHVGTDADLIPVTDEPRTQILPLKFVSAAEVMKDLGDVLRKAMGEGGQVAVSTFANAILLSGRSEGIHRVAEILRVVDQTASAQVRIAVLPLAHADATELVKTLNEICKREPAKAEPAGATPLPGLFRMMRAGAADGAASRSPAHEVIRITAEPRTNSVVVAATEENLDLVRGLLQRLDLPDAALQTYVVPLRTADAATVAAMLDALWNGQGKVRTTPSNQPRSDGTIAPGQQPFGSTPSTSGVRRTGGSTPRR